MRLTPALTRRMLKWWGVIAYRKSRKFPTRSWAELLSLPESPRFDMRGAFLKRPGRTQAQKERRRK